MLDRQSAGPRWLAQPPIANLVAEAILRGEKDRRFYELAAWVVMPNHVHVLFLPRRPLRVILRWLKGSTARRANQALGRAGEFWQEESFDHWVRNQREFEKIVRYIEQNPVSAGLAAAAELWQWSSAARQAEAPALPGSE
jgi:REP element-mobilizing transposase RayT